MVSSCFKSNHRTTFSELGQNTKRYAYTEYGGSREPHCFPDLKMWYAFTLKTHNTCTLLHMYSSSCNYPPTQFSYGKEETPIICGNRPVLPLAARKREDSNVCLSIDISKPIRWRRNRLRKPVASGNIWNKREEKRIMNFLWPWHLGFCCICSRLWGHFRILSPQPPHISSLMCWARLKAAWKKTFGTTVLASLEQGVSPWRRMGVQSLWPWGRWWPRLCFFSFSRANKILSPLTLWRPLYVIFSWKREAFSEKMKCFKRYINNHILSHSGIEN